MEKQSASGLFKASTRDVAKSNKVDYWASMLADIWGQIQIEPTNAQEFEGQIQSTKLNQLVFNEIKFKGHNLHRTRSNIAKMKQGFYSLAFPKGKPWLMTQCNETFMLQPGNIYLLSNMIPYKSQDKGGYETFNIMIPSQILENLVPYLEPHYFFPLHQGNKKANILHDFVKSIYESLPLSSEDDACFMENNLLNLLAYVLKDESQSICIDDSSVRLAHRQRILDYISKNLPDEFMSPETIAKQHGISVSYLHRIFKPTDNTIVEIIRHKRLAKARQLLADNDFKGLSITEIAYRLGFKHPSDFSRAFKRLYGMSPKESRNLDQDR